MTFAAWTAGILSYGAIFLCAGHSIGALAGALTAGLLADDLLRRFAR